MLSPTETWYRLKKLYALYPGVGAPVSGQFLADHYSRRRSARSLPRAALDGIVGLGFDAWLPFRARAAQRRYGLDDAWRVRATAIARERFADPNDIALFRIEHAAELETYIRRFEDAGLNKLVNPAAWRPDCALADKVRLYDRCAAANLPHPEVIATIVGSRIEVRDTPRGRPLLLKPARGEGGRGVQLLADGAPDTAPDFAAWLARVAGPRKHAWLVQRRIAVHLDLIDLALNALPTARMTTILNGDGVPELVNAVLRIPSDPAVVVDNMKAGGLLSPVDLADGSLGVACKGYGGGDYTAHPVTGAAIVGRRLPEWDAARTLVVDAHRRGFGDYALIGWDVGFSPDGPVLIEGNGKPGVLMPQRAGRCGLGGQRYGELLALQLALAVTK